jgi:hypothetical protein
VENGAQNEGGCPAPLPDPAESSAWTVLSRGPYLAPPGHPSIMGLSGLCSFLDHTQSSWAPGLHCPKGPKPIFKAWFHRLQGNGLTCTFLALRGGYRAVCGGCRGTVCVSVGLCLCDGRPLRFVSQPKVEGEEGAGAGLPRLSSS